MGDCVCMRPQRYPVGVRNKAAAASNKRLTRDIFCLICTDVMTAVESVTRTKRGKPRRLYALKVANQFSETRKVTQQNGVMTLESIFELRITRRRGKGDMTCITGCKRLEAMYQLSCAHSPQGRGCSLELMLDGLLWGKQASKQAVHVWYLINTRSCDARWCAWSVKY